MAPSRDRRPGFSRRAQYSLFLGYVLAIAGALVGAVLLVLSTFNPAAFAALRMTVSTVTTPGATALAAAGRGIRAVPDTIATYFRVHGENAELRARLKQSDALLMRARTLNYDNRRLRALLQFREGNGAPVVSARLVGSTPSSTRRFATLNAGLWQGVREGQPVLGPEGLVGRVLETGPASARVLLLIDPDSVVPVKRTRDGLPAIVVGRGDGLVDVRSVQSITGNFQQGDVFVTSGVGGIYAPGIPVARTLRRGSDAAMARPFATPDTLDFALVTHVFMPEPPAPRQPQP